MNGSGVSRPLDRGNVGPAGVTARDRCSVCQKVQSRGQYPVGSDTCVTCQPQGAGWRRGDLPIIGEFK